MLLKSKPVYRTNMSDLLNDVRALHERVQGILKEDPGETIRIDFSREKLTFVEHCLQKYGSLIEGYRENQRKVALEAAKYVKEVVGNLPYLIDAVASEDADGNSFVRILVNDLKGPEVTFTNGTLIYGVPVKLELKEETP